MTKSINFVEQTPDDIKELETDSKDKTDYKKRLKSIDKLGNYKCTKSIKILYDLMNNDKVYAVQELAFRKLQSFGENVKLPRKKKGHLIPDINKKLGKVKNTLEENFSIEDFNKKFKELYPEAFDVFQFEKKGNFNNWITNVLTNLPKK